VGRKLKFKPGIHCNALAGHRSQIESIDRAIQSYHKFLAYFWFGISTWRRRGWGLGLRVGRSNGGSGTGVGLGLEGIHGPIPCWTCQCKPNKPNLPIAYLFFSEGWLGDEGRVANAGGLGVRKVNGQSAGRGHGSDGFVSLLNAQFQSRYIREKPEAKKVTFWQMIIEQEGRTLSRYSTLL